MSYVSRFFTTRTLQFAASRVSFIITRRECQRDASKFHILQKFHSLEIFQGTNRVILQFLASDFRLFLRGGFLLTSTGREPRWNFVPRSNRRHWYDAKVRKGATTTMTFLSRGGRGAIARNQYIRDKERVTSGKFAANICASRFALFTSHRLNVPSRALEAQRRRERWNPGVPGIISARAPARAIDVSFERDSPDIAQLRGAAFQFSSDDNVYISFLPILPYRFSRSRCASRATGRRHVAHWIARGAANDDESPSMMIGRFRVSEQKAAAASARDDGDANLRS